SSGTTGTNAVITVNAAASAANRIAYNTIISQQNAVLINYTGTATITDQVTGNLLTEAGSTAGTATGMVLVGSGIDGLTMQRNVFLQGKIGVFVSAAAGASLANIDLGGGSQGSLGINNFRSFTTSATSTSGAIVLSGTGLTGTLQAQRNIFGVSNVGDVVFDA